MALNSTVRKLDLSVADMDRGYYASHSLTLAQHPSETDLRLMLRVLAFGLFAHEQLEFGRGLSTDDEPDLWQRELDGTIVRWIDLGMPDDKRIRKACGRARQVVIITYGGSKAQVWLERQRASLLRNANLTVLNIRDAQAKELSALIARSMGISLSIQDGQVLASGDTSSATLEPLVIQTP